MLRDVLRDTWAYQEIMQEGFDKGIEKGIEKGIVKGREEEREEELRRQRQLLMTIIQMHFPNITNLAQKQADAIKDPQVLQNLIFKVLAAQTEEEATQSLLKVSQQ